MHDIASIARNPIRMPAGALGIWYASDYETVPRKRIRNSLAPSNTPIDQNLLTCSRRLFTNTLFGVANAGVGNTIVDANATAPDGSGDATTVTAAGTNTWSLRTNPNTMTLPAGTYTLCVSAKSISGSTSFQLGDNTTGLAAQTATGSWARYTKTFTTTGSVFLITAGPVTIAAQTLLFCDMELFAGSVDLNPNPLGAPPLSIQNIDLKLGKSAIDASSVVTNGALINGSSAILQFPTALTPANYTVIYVARRSAAGNNAGFQAVIANAGIAAYTAFAAGNNNNNIGTILNATQLNAAYTAGTIQTKFDLFSRGIDGGGVFTNNVSFVGAHRYDGTTSNSFVNGVKVLNNAITVSSPSNLKDLYVGAHATGFYSGMDLYALAYYPRALSDAEMLQAYKSLVARLNVPSPRTVIFEGTSIELGLAGVSYAYRFPANAVPQVTGANNGWTGSRLSDLVARAPALDAELPIAPTQRFILSVGVGGNDIGNVSVWGANPNGFTAALATYLDARRAAGWKVVIHTIVARNDSSDGGAQFNSDRATANATIRTWLGIHCDAIADVASDTTIGIDSAAGSLITGAVAGTANVLRISVSNAPSYFTAGVSHVGLTGTLAGLSLTGYTGLATTSYLVSAVGTGWIELSAITVNSGIWTSGGNCLGNNYWNIDGVHPIDAAYVIWETYTRAAINSL